MFDKLSLTEFNLKEKNKDVQKNVFIFGSPSWTRTNDTAVNSRVLYRLSYGGILKPTKQSLIGYLCRHRPIFPGRFQPSIFGSAAKSDCENLTAAVCDILSEEAGVPSDRSYAVSYTHLDVYKRQGLDTLVVHTVNDDS